MKVKDILKILSEDGWYKVKSKSSHIQLKHESKRGRVTVPYHGRNIELPTKTLRSILQQAKIDLED